MLWKIPIPMVKRLAVASTGLTWELQRKLSSRTESNWIDCHWGHREGRVLSWCLWGRRRKELGAGRLWTGARQEGRFPGRARVLEACSLSHDNSRQAF